MIWLLWACAPEPEPCESLEWNTGIHSFFVSYCGACHAANTPDRHGAPVSVTFDTEEEARSWAARVWQTVLVQESMPPAGGVFPEDKERIQEWLQCP